MNSDKQKKLKAFPRYESDAAAENFVDEVDLTQYDLSGFKPKSYSIISITKPVQ